MAKNLRLIPDPELDQLVRELNQTNAAENLGEYESEDEAAPAGAAARGPQWPASTVRSGEPFEQLLIEMAQRGASDLIVVAGAPPLFPVGGRLVRAESSPFQADAVSALLGGGLSRRPPWAGRAGGGAAFSLRPSLC